MEVDQQVWARIGGQWCPAVVADVQPLDGLENRAGGGGGNGEQAVVKVRLAAAAADCGVEAGSEHTFTVEGNEDADDVRIANADTSAHAVDDLTTLTHLHEPAIVHALRQRYETDQIYTYTGPILIAVNPFWRVPLYDNERLQTYVVDAEGQAPHPWALAAQAYDAVFGAAAVAAATGEAANQSILVSGESGAGKTETTKIMMQFLAVVGSRSEVATGVADPNTGAESKTEARASAGAFPALNHSDEVVGVHQQVLQSNPILESFGNARTVRNDNSSRFGKYIELHFGKRGDLLGASIRTFLLEKVRITAPAELERNYHVFYLMCAGATQQERERWRLHDRQPVDLHYLAVSQCFRRRDGANDTQLYAGLRQAMCDLGFREEEQHNVFEVTAGVILLGNIEFEDEGEASGASSALRPSESTASALEDICALWQVNPDTLKTALTTRAIHARGETVVTKLPVDGARAARDALARAVYANLFTWLVGRVNDGMGDEDALRTRHAFVGLLDIFGFESFQRNSLEQLLINYCNERLQHQFNSFVLDHEQKEYAAEGIAWDFVDFPDNLECISLVDARRSSVFALLDEQCMLRNGSDNAFVHSVYDRLGESPYLEVSSAMRPRLQFAVRHYAGVVAYDTDGFTEKNKDKLHSEGVDVIRNSAHPFVPVLTPGTDGGDKDGTSMVKGMAATLAVQPTPINSPVPASAGGGAAGTPGSVRRPSTRPGAKKTRTVCGQFRGQLNTLIDTISMTQPHYVRCLKPNDVAKPANFDPPRIAEQLRYGGVLEAVRVARAGFPVRFLHRSFLRQYSVIGSQLIPQWHSLVDSGRVQRQQQQQPSEQEKVQAQERVQTLISGIVPYLGTDTSGITKPKRRLSKRPSRRPPPVAASAGAEASSALSGLSRGLLTSSTSTVANSALADGLQMGHTKVFLKHESFRALESMRTRAELGFVVLVQKVGRGWHARYLYRRDCARVVTCQALARRKQAYRQAQRLREVRAATMFQALWRMGRIRQAYVWHRDMIVLVQTVCRRKLARMRTRRIIEQRAAVCIQDRWHTYRARNVYLWCRRMMIRLQAHARRRLAAPIIARKLLEADKMASMAARLEEIEAERRAEQEEALKAKEELQRQMDELAAVKRQMREEKERALEEQRRELDRERKQYEEELARKQCEMEVEQQRQLRALEERTKRVQEEQQRKLEEAAAVLAHQSQVYVQSPPPPVATDTAMEVDEIFAREDLSNSPVTSATTHPQRRAPLVPQTHANTETRPAASEAAALLAAAPATSTQALAEQHSDPGPHCTGPDAVIESVEDADLVPPVEDMGALLSSFADSVKDAVVDGVHTAAHSLVQPVTGSFAENRDAPRDAVDPSEPGDTTPSMGSDNETDREAEQDASDVPIAAQIQRLRRLSEVRHSFSPAAVSQHLVAGAGVHSTPVPSSDMESVPALMTSYSNGGDAESAQTPSPQAAWGASPATASLYNDVVPAPGAGSVASSVSSLSNTSAGQESVVPSATRYHSHGGIHISIPSASLRQGTDSTGAASAEERRRNSVLLLQRRGSVTATPPSADKLVDVDDPRLVGHFSGARRQRSRRQSAVVAALTSVAQSAGLVSDSDTDAETEDEDGGGNGKPARSTAQQYRRHTAEEDDRSDADEDGSEDEEEEEEETELPSVRVVVFKIHVSVSKIAQSTAATVAGAAAVAGLGLAAGDGVDRGVAMSPADTGLIIADRSLTARSMHPTDTVSEPRFRQSRSVDADQDPSLASPRTPRSPPHGMLGSNMSQSFGMTPSLDSRHHGAREHVVVRRRYCEFKWLHEQLTAAVPTSEMPELPERTLWQHDDPEFIEERRSALEVFLRQLQQARPNWFKLLLVDKIDVEAMRMPTAMRRGIEALQMFLDPHRLFLCDEQDENDGSLLGNVSSSISVLQNLFA